MWCWTTIKNIAQISVKELSFHIWTWKQCCRCYKLSTLRGGVVRKHPPPSHVSSGEGVVWLGSIPLRLAFWATEGVCKGTFQSPLLGTFALPQVLLTELTCGSPSNVFRSSSDDFPTTSCLTNLYNKDKHFDEPLLFLFYFIFYFLMAPPLLFFHCAIFYLFSPSSHLGIYKYLIWQEISHLVLFGHPVR